MDETKTYWEKSNAPIAGFIRLIINKKKKEKTMTEKKILKLRFGKKPQEEPEAAPISFDEKLEQIKQANEIPSNKATETPNRSPMIQPAPIKRIEPQEQATKSPDISAEIQTIIKAYKGDLSKVWKFIIETFEGEDLATAGYQICLIQTNERLARENALKEILENIRRGIIAIPFDPREDPTFIKIIKTIKGSEPAFVREYKEQVLPKETHEKVIPAPAPTPEKIKEDYTTKKEQRLADIHSMIDDEAIEEDGVSQ